MIKGGPEERCVGEEWDKAIGVHVERPCPRVDLPPELLAEAELLTWLLHRDKRVLAEARFYTMCSAWNLSAEDADVLLSRVAHVLSDSSVMSLIHPGPELPEDDES